MLFGFYGMLLIIEPLRLYLGHVGNLKERLQSISASFMWSLWQIGVASYLIGLQSMTGDGWCTPFEFAILFLYLLLLIPQTILSYIATKNIISADAVEYFTKE
jgi:hypothetical protein